MLRTIRTTFSATVLFALFFSGIIRHDRTEEDHTRLASEKQFDGVGQVRIDTSSAGSSVLIGERFVLSAAHVFIESDFQADTMIVDGQVLIAYRPVNERVVDPNKVRIRIKGKELRVKRILLHPNFLDEGTAGSCDLALLELEEAFTEVEPAFLNRDTDEMNANVVGVGYGASGTADKPETVEALDLKIAGENVIDSIGGFAYSNRPTLLFCDFDHPTRTDCNKTGGATPRPLEYISSGGDSGGPLFRQKDARWELVGICEGSSTDIQQLLATGYYGQIMTWTRVSAFAEWITENTK